LERRRHDEMREPPRDDGLLSDLRHGEEKEKNGKKRYVFGGEYFFRPTTKSSDSVYSKSLV
jgi:hypothetical protein